jgi:hypothetical protein
VVARKIQRRIIARGWPVDDGVSKDQSRARVAAIDALAAYVQSEAL